MATGAAPRPTRKWLVWWTALNIVFVALPLLSDKLDDRPARIVLFMIGAMGNMVVGAVVAHRRGPFARYLPLIVPALLVGPWPLFRFLVHQETRPANIFLSLQAFVLALTAVWTALQFVRDRGWVVDSPWRSRLLVLGMVAMLVNSLLHLQYPVVTWGIIVGQFATMLWPSRWTPRSARRLKI